MEVIVSHKGCTTLSIKGLFVAVSTTVLGHYVVAPVTFGKELISSVKKLKGIATRKK
jgi:hypothetical protein